MTQQDKAILLCLSGLDTEEFIRHVTQHLHEKARLILLYVIDTRPHEERGYSTTPLDPSILEAEAPALELEHGITTAEELEAQEVLNLAESKLLRLGYDPHATSRQVRKGKPEREIIDVTLQPELNIGMVVIGSNYKRGLKTGPGPLSIGRVTRFVVEHSACDVLVLR
jgi:nucleotide-binding universal stress UspA family protein